MIFFNCVSKSYKEGKKAVDNLSLTIEDGTIFGFLGPNGAGKSTTIKMIVGLLSQDSGTISIDSTSDALQIKRNLGYVPDEPLFYERMTGMEHIDFICNVFQVSDRKQRTEELCTLFDFHALS
ncbi:MAG: ABC transporter ATP-binding protein, partial [Sphaerochaetaceae bacterium]